MPAYSSIGVRRLVSQTSPLMAFGVWLLPTKSQPLLPSLLAHLCKMGLLGHQSRIVISFGRLSLRTGAQGGSKAADQTRSYTSMKS